MATLAMELDDLTREIRTPLNWQLTVPIETRMALLKDYRSYQHDKIQNVCKHAKFDEREECEQCGLKCEHWDEDDGYCVDCGRYLAADRDDEPEEVDYER